MSYSNVEEKNTSSTYLNLNNETPNYSNIEDLENWHGKPLGKNADEVLQHLSGLIKNKGKLQLQQRNIIPNDTKLFAQADIEFDTKYYLTSDAESKKIYSLLAKASTPKFQFRDLNNSHSAVFGIMDF